MYSSPSIVIGYHGCDQSVADKVLKEGRRLSVSENAYDWLGHGQYFWEGSYSRALEWASRKPNPAVVGAFIRLGNCLDLLDASRIQDVKTAYEVLRLEYELLGQILPVNRVVHDDISYIRELDCKVIMSLHETIKADIAIELGAKARKKEVQRHPRFIDSVRGMFPEGPALYEGAGFREKNHIQLCIVNPNCIIGYFNPLKINKNYKSLQ